MHPESARVIQTGNFLQSNLSTVILFINIILLTLFKDFSLSNLSKSEIKIEKIELE